MKTVTYNIGGINNFHNCGPITVRIAVTNTVRGYTGHDYYPISKGQAQRVLKHFCGIDDCHCAAGGVVIDLNEYQDKGILIDET